MPKTKKFPRMWDFLVLTPGKSPVNQGELAPDTLVRYKHRGGTWKKCFWDDGGVIEMVRQNRKLEWPIYPWDIMLSGVCVRIEFYVGWFSPQNSYWMEKLYRMGEKINKIVKSRVGTVCHALKTNLEFRFLWGVVPRVSSKT